MVLPQPSWTYNREVAVVKGVAYFLVAPYHVNAWIEPKMHHAWIMAFDLENKVWHRIVMPYLEVQSPPVTSCEYFVKPLAVIDDRMIVVWMQVAAPGFGSVLDAVMRYYDLTSNNRGFHGCNTIF